MVRPSGDPPRLGHHRSAGLLDGHRHRAADVGLVHEQLGDGHALTLQVLHHLGGTFLLWTIGSRHPTGVNQLAVQTRGQVLFVSGNQLAAALASVSHLRLFDGDPAVGDGALTNVGVARLLFDVLPAHLGDGLNVGGERMVEGELMALDPPDERINLGR